MSIKAMIQMRRVAMISKRRVERDVLGVSARGCIGLCLYSAVLNNSVSVLRTFQSSQDDYTANTQIKQKNDIVRMRYYSLTYLAEIKNKSAYNDTRIKNGPRDQFCSKMT